MDITVFVKYKYLILSSSMMVIEKIELKPYKQHQGEGDQVSYHGIALNPIETACAKKINEIIDALNTQ